MELYNWKGNLEVMTPITCSKWFEILEKNHGKSIWL